MNRQNQKCNLQLLFENINTKFLIFSILFFIFGLCINYETHASSITSIKGKYPTYGSPFLSSFNNFEGPIYISSNNCNSAESGAYSKIFKSTDGQTEMQRFINGINMIKYNCTGSWDSEIDIKLNYVATHPTPGENFDISNPSSFCEYWGFNYPCGKRAQVKISKAWWNNASSVSRQRLIMHETGHSMGLNHNCGTDSIMNSGLTSCNNGAWTKVMEYKIPDRKGINSIY